MASYISDFVCETALSPGTSSTVSLLGKAAGLPVMTFATAGIANGARIYFTITDGSSLSESCLGTFHTGTPNTVSRDTVVSNTAGSTARLNFTGTVFVFCFPPATKMAVLNETDALTLPGALSAAGLADFSVGGVKVSQAPAASITAPLRADQTWQVVAKYSMSAVASQTVPLPTVFSRFRLLMSNVAPSVTSVVALRFSQNQGGTWLTGATYVQGVSLVNTATGLLNAASGVAATQLNLSVDLTGSSEWDATIDIWPGNALKGPIIRGNGFGVSNSAAAWMFWATGGTWTGTAALMNACQVFPFAGGTITGTLVLEGLP